MQHTPDAFARMTRQRRLILEYVRRSRSHPTADEVYEAVRRDLPHVSLGTVYRNLDVLSRCGVIHRLELAGTMSRFDGRHDGHSHVRCVECGRLDDVNVALPEGLDKLCSQASGYCVRAHKLEFHGLCPDCRRLAERGGAGT
jgi:Fur family ferric uptake transcriptional regulator